MHKVWKWEELGMLNYEQAKEMFLGDTITILDAYPVGIGANIDQLPNSPMLSYIVPRDYPEPENYKGHWGVGINVLYNWPNDSIIQRFAYYGDDHLEIIEDKGLSIVEKIEGECKYDSLTGSCFWNYPGITLSIKIAASEPRRPDGYSLYGILLGMRYPKVPSSPSK